MLTCEPSGCEMFQAKGWYCGEPPDVGLLDDGSAFGSEGVAAGVGGVTTQLLVLGFQTRPPAVVCIGCCIGGAVAALAATMACVRCVIVGTGVCLSLIHISEPTRLGMISYAVFCL